MCRASCVCISSLRGRCHAVVPGVLVCVHVYMLYVCVYICVCVYVCMCVDMYICIYMHVCMYMYLCALNTCVCVCACIFGHRLWVSVSVLQRVDGVMHAHVYSCAYVCVCTCVYLYIYVHFFAVSVACTFGTGVFGTSAWAGVNVTQVCFLHQRTHLRHTRCRVCTYVYMHICLYMHAHVYGCVCASMILLDTLRRCYLDFLSVHTCAICMRMYMCVHVCVYRCLCMCMYMYICMSVYTYAYTFIYTRVWVYICTRVGAFCLFVLSNPYTTCACITGVS